MRDTTCQLTVLMAVHNGMPFLRTAIESILKQTYRRFHFLIVDDASTDETRDIVRSYDDPRIELLCLERNVGQTAALNIGLRHASTPWIARMDADDYSAPTRFEEQMRLLDESGSLTCVGTFAWIFRDDPHMVEGTIERPLDSAAIRRGLLHGAPMIHGSLVIRRAALLEVGAYNERYRYSADRDLYNRLLTRYPAANVPQQLLGIRWHESQGSFSNVATDENIEIFSRMLVGSEYTPKEKTVLRRSLAYTYFARAKGWAAQRQYGELLQDLARAFRASPTRTLRGLAAYPIPDRMRVRLRQRFSRKPS